MTPVGIALFWQQSHKSPVSTLLKRDLQRVASAFPPLLTPVSFKKHGNKFYKDKNVMAYSHDLRVHNSSFFFFF